MAITLLLRDKDDRAWGKVEAVIHWDKGQSKIWVPETGSAVFNTEGYIDYIIVAGKSYPEKRRVKDGDVVHIRKR